MGLHNAPYRETVSAHKPRDERVGYHHVVTRGNNKQRIYLSNADRRRFLELVNYVAEKYYWEILAYCLMRNHYHLVVRVTEGGLSRGMCELNGAYSLHFNRTHNRINHLFGKRYWSEYLDEKHLRNAIRYVIQNPRRAGARGPLEAHAWTSYRASIGLALSFPRFARDELLALFGSKPAEAVGAFIAFCEAPRTSGEREPPRRQPP
jgi:REP element-mobilizing transposase RayT